jgi:hypothetical protein
MKFPRDLARRMWRALFGLACVLILAGPARAADIASDDPVPVKSRVAAERPAGRLLLREVYDVAGKKVVVEEYTDKEAIEEKPLVVPKRIPAAAARAQQERPTMLQDSQGYWYKQWADGTVQWCVECNQADAKAKATKVPCGTAAAQAPCQTCGEACDCGTGCACEDVRTGRVKVSNAGPTPVKVQRPIITPVDPKQRPVYASGPPVMGATFELAPMNGFPPTPVPITVYDERNGSSFVVPATPGYQTARRPQMSTGFAVRGPFGGGFSAGACASPGG